MNTLRFIIGLILFAASLGSSLSYAASSQSEISYKNSSIYFHAIKSDSKFTYSDQLGTRSLDIKNCNKKLIDQYWSQMVKSAQNVQTKNIKGRLPASAELKYEGIELQVLQFDPAASFFNKVPNNALVLFAESKKLCKK
jgi:hypothetical protein